MTWPANNTGPCGGHKDTDMTAKTTKKELENIARSVLGLDTLATQNSDRLDFHEVAVWQIQEALEAAYKAGQASK